MQDNASHNFTLVGVFIVWLGPVVGPYALIVFAALAGSALALTVEKPSSRWEGIKFLFMSTLIAVLLTGPFAYVVEKYTEVPANIALIPVAVGLGVARTKLVPFIHKLLDAIAAGVSSFSKAAASRRSSGK